MKYELGRVLEFNKAEWGFIDYKKGRLTVFSLKDNKKVNFKVIESKFKDIYSRSSKISQETIDFAMKEEKEREDLLNQLKPGIKFIGGDNEAYTFLKFKGKKILFYNDKDEFSANPEFAKSLTGDFDANYRDHLTPVTTKKEFNSLSNEDKVKIAINYCKQCFKTNEDDEFEILDIGNIVSGEAYYHEVDDYYNLIGLQIRYKSKFSFQEEPSVDNGFFPIYIGRTSDYYPISFEESYSDSSFTEHHYTNGLGDSIEIDKILTKKELLKDIKF